MISARLLGAIELDLDGRPAPRAVLWRKHLALCLLLWHATERRLPRDRALALLWGDRDERDARHSLNEALRVLRRAMGEGSIDTDRDWVTWRGELRLDTDRFAALERSDPIAAGDLVTGDWCEGFTLPGAPECERWFEDERRWWRTRLVAALVRGATLAEGRGDLAQALSLVMRARRLEPLGEATGRSLIRIQFLAGDRAGALETGRTLLRQLADELGVEPGEETRTLLRAIASGDALAGEIALTAPATDPPLPLVGREAVMERLTATLGSCRLAPRSAMILVEGEPGSGRTRLLEEVVARGTADGASVLLLRAVPSDIETEAAGLRALAAIALRNAPGVAAVPPTVVRTLVQEVPEWAERFAPPPGDDMPLATALAAVMRTAAVERPLVVALDDIDFLDDATLGALPELLRATADLPVLLVVAATASDRRRPVDRIAEHLDRDERGHVLRLEALDDAALELVVAITMPDWDHDARLRLVRRLAADSAGLPGVAFPVLAAIAAGLDLDDAPWPARDRTYDATLPSRLPGSLVAAVRLRFHQLGPAARQVLAAVALAGQPASPSWVSATTGLPGDEVVRCLDELEEMRWLVSDDRGYQCRARAIGGLVASELITPGVRRRLLRAADDARET